MASDTLFKEKAPAIMLLLMPDFDLDEVSAAAILGNLGHESMGFEKLQEMDPVGGRGGWGWAQWTGPRRRDFEAYCERNDLDPASDDANYGFLWVELKGSEKAAIPAVQMPGTMRDKVMRFELKFERAGVKHYDSRLEWAEKALAAYRASQEPAEPLPVPPVVMSLEDRVTALEERVAALEDAPF